MYERAKYFSNRFIRNGIAGVIILSLILYGMIEKHDTINPTFIGFVLFPIFWLTYGLWIRRKLQFKSPVVEIDEKAVYYKQIQFVLSICVVVLIYLGLDKKSYAAYIAIPFLVIYFGWIYKQMKLINAYLNS